MKKLILLLLGFFFIQPSFVSAENIPVSDNRIREKIAGCIFGAAYGDALGGPVEFIKSREQINQAYPPNGITGFESLKQTDLIIENFLPKVPYTDDTAMTLVVLKEIIKNIHLYKPPFAAGFTPPSLLKRWNVVEAISELAEAFVKDMDNPDGWAKPSRAPGNACLKNIKKIKDRLAVKKNDQKPIWIAGSKTDGGCGSVMHVHPFGIVFSHDLKSAEEWAVVHSKITHRAPIALAACAAMAVGVANAINDVDVVQNAHYMAEVARKYDIKTADMIEKAIAYAQDPNKSSDEVFEEFQGWAAHEAISAATYILVKRPNNLKQAIILGVNTPGDSDSIASMAGALVGAYVGIVDPSEYSIIEKSDHISKIINEISDLVLNIRRDDYFENPFSGLSRHAAEKSTNAKKVFQKVPWVRLIGHSAEILGGCYAVYLGWPATSYLYKDLWQRGIHDSVKVDEHYPLNFRCNKRFPWLIRSLGGNIIGLGLITHGFKGLKKVYEETK